ncbi:MAG: radical SAM protein [Gemmatimonadetes bacterium]|nr:radical SAM protein [Gemmatimonadota bacterium]
MSEPLTVPTDAAAIGPGFASRPVRAPSLDSDAAGATPIPHVVAWNLTQRCNLACAHCYISAGSWHTASGELTTAECQRITDEILELSPAPMFILSGGEPLLREDLELIASYATERGATVVVGTNGTRLSRERIRSLKDAGVTGVAISVDSLDARYHDRFRHGTGALSDTLAAVERLREERLDFVVQTTVTRGNRPEIAAIADWAATAGAVSFNVYFLVATGRGEGMHGLTPAENDDVLSELIELGRTHRGRMMVRSKCQPQIMRHAYEDDPDSPLLQYGTRCPCGVHYARITPEGKLTPCPYTPVVAGDLRRQSFAEVWRESPVFAQIRGGEVGGKCGACEYRGICGGCRARAYADTGDLMAADASCAYEPPGDRPLVRPRAVAYGAATSPAQMPWTDEATRRIERVPGFVRNVVVERVERFARERGYEAVTPEVMDEVRKSMPVDFSRRLPFFLRDRAGSGAE